MTGPLDGVRILTFTQAWAGTSATLLLGLLGADVIQIESRSHPDVWRGGYGGSIPPGLADPKRDQRRWNLATSYNSVNLNKRAITLDVGTSDGLALFKRLVPLADVVADNFTPTVMRKWGLDYETLRALKPDIIQASLSAYGATGPLKDARGIGGTMEPMSGLTSLLGYVDGPPMNSGAMIPDALAGLWFAAAIVTALRHRAATGTGQYIDLGMMEADASIAPDALLEATANGRVRPREGNRHPRCAPHNFYPTADDGWLAIAIENDQQWDAFVHLVREGELARDARFETMAARKTNEPELDERIAAWCRLQDADALEASLLNLGVPAARARGRRELLEHPSVAERGFAARIEHPEAGAQLVAGAPWKMSATPPAVTRPAPMLGQHSWEVFHHSLGMTEAEYDDLVSRGISGDSPPTG